MKEKHFTVICYIFLSVCCIFTVFPFLFLMALSVRDKKDLIRNGVMNIPREFHFDNYVTAWKQGHFSTYFMNSILISVISVIGVIVLATLIAYALSYYDFRGKTLVELLMLVGLIIPFEIIIIPLYYNYKLVGILGTRSSVYLTQIALNIPISVFILKGFIDDIPTSLVEAARIDGASEWNVLGQVIAPIIVPAEVSILILVFMWTWNDFMLGNIMLKSEAVRTLPLGLSYFQGKYSRDIPMTSSASVIIMAPVILVYAIFQKQMVEGLTVGAVKG